MDSKENSSHIGSQDCYPVAYEIRHEESKIFKVYLILAIVFGIIIGALLALIVFRFCCKRLWKRLSIKETNTEKKSLTKGDHKPVNLEEQLESTVNSTGNAMCDVILKERRDQTESELMKQDIATATRMEDDLLEKRKMLSEKLAAIHLNEKSQGTIYDKEALEKVLSEFHSHLVQTEQRMDADLKANLEMLKNDPELMKNEQKMIDETNKLKAAHKRNLHVLFKNALEEFREILRKHTKLSPQEIDEIVDKLKRSLANLELMLSDNIDEQMQFLENNLANRQYLLSQFIDANDNIESKMKNHEDVAKKMLDKLSEDKKISAQIKEKMLQDFKAAICGVKSQHRAEIRREMEQMAEKLRKVQDERLTKLKMVHKEQTNKILKQAETMTDAEKFLKIAKELLEQQTEESNEEKTDLDKEQASKMHNIYLKLEQSLENALKQQLDTLREKISSNSKMDNMAVKHLMSEYEMEIRNLEKMREMERKVHLSTLREKLEERKRNMEQEMARKDSEQRRITKQQDNILQKVIDSQRELDDKDRSQILIEHEHNQLVLTSLLSLSKLKHERLLAQKLATRRNTLTKEDQMRKRKESKSRRLSIKSKGDNNKTNEEINNERKDMEEHAQLLAQDMRDGIALETKVLMDEQDANMAELLGRLQVSQARRQVLIDRQDKLVKKLENELKQHSKALSNDDVKHLDSILDDHRKQVDQLNKVLETTKQKQMQNLQAKLEEKRLKNKKALEEKFEADEEDILTKSMNNRMSFATSLLCQNKLNARHQRALDHLDSEMRVELERQKEQLNKETQKELERALLEQKKQFLNQLAIIIKLSPEELKMRAKHAQQYASESKQPLLINVDQQQSQIVESNSLPKITNSRLPPIGMTLLVHQVADENVEMSENMNAAGTSTRKRRTKKRRMKSKQLLDDQDNDEHST